MIKVTIDAKFKTILIEGDIFPEQRMDFSEWDEWGSIYNEDCDAMTHDWHILYDEDGLSFVMYELDEQEHGSLEMNASSNFIYPDELVVENEEYMLEENDGYGSYPGEYEDEE